MNTLIVLVLGIVVSTLISKVAAYRLANAEPARARTVMMETDYARSGGKIILFLTIVGCLGSAFTWTFKQIPAGNIGIATLWGKVQESPLPEGLNIVNPLFEIHLMSAQIQKHEPKGENEQTKTYTAASKDLQILHVQMVLNYRLIVKDAPRVFRETGLNYEGKIIDPAAHEVLKGVMTKHAVVEILQQRSIVKDEIQKGLKEWLERYGIELLEVSLQNISFDQEYEKAVERKQIQEQEAEAKVYKLQQAVKDVEIATAQAKGKAEARKMEAEGEASALRLKADAEAEYNRKVSESLNEVLLRQKWVERWNGQVPTYMMGGTKDVGLLMQVPATPEKK